ncbi:ABC-type phosphate/phosphonate transport system%2Cperiplasmic component [Yersinia pekkanenii]|uniref:ABC-type phosphate/phosphonate transport system,periplasmic component n=1 Tax=Yersinia pekkanenii TaxID=1288385 RepID=A0A0T9QSH5_9GAMM|nr:ABC-type phosphate/phosphonate transport system%2Cperiplasmic component [Yersinia pekkanenii]CRY68271.1 ABC-type phosphate/phosphonate transport system%2Cperiplasmic component [Yersinia pekkanenii]
MLISRPMYGVQPQDVHPFWQLLLQQLRHHEVSGISEQLVWLSDLLQH